MAEDEQPISEPDPKNEERQDDYDTSVLDEMASPINASDSDALSSFKFGNTEAQFFSSLINSNLKDDVLNLLWSKEAVIGNFDGKPNTELGDFNNQMDLSQDLLIVGLERSSRKLRGYAYGKVMGSRNKDGFQQKIFISKLIESMKTLKKGNADKKESGAGGIIGQINKFNSE